MKTEENKYGDTYYSILMDFWTCNGWNISSHFAKDLITIGADKDDNVKILVKDEFPLIPNGSPLLLL